MKYFKNIEGDYITSLSTGCGTEEITEEAFAALLDVIASRPTPDAGYNYLLRTDLTWELVELPSPAEEDVSAEEALDIIMGVSE